MKKKKDESILEKDIHKLRLHETTKIGKYDITRVPGGWIYHNTKYGIDSGLAVTDTFVPLNYEFQEEEIVK